MSRFKGVAKGGILMFVPRQNPDGFWQVSMEYIPFVDSDKFNCGGSYNVIMARFIGLSYPDYLRYCRDKHNGILRGRAGYTYCVYICALSSIF